MSRPIVLGVAALLLFTLGVIAANTRIAQGVIPVTPYEADVNKDGRVNVADLGNVATRYGQVVPTATPIAAPAYYTAEAGMPFSTTNADGFAEASVDCDSGDTATGGGAKLFPTQGYQNSMDLNDRAFPKLTAGKPTGWAVQYEGFQAYGASTAVVYVVCFDNAPTHTP